MEGKRICMKRKVPNPVFQGWLEELLDEAKGKKSKLEPLLQEALTSLSKYPLPLQTGSDCAILKGFDKKLCLFLDQRLEVYNARVSNDSSESSSSVSKGSSPITITPNSNNLNNENDENRTNHTGGSKEHIAVPVKSSSVASKTSNKVRIYKPLFKSGGYAILMALLEHTQSNPNALMKKSEVIDLAQKYSEESFIRPKPGTYYTAWSNMSKLVSKNLVEQKRSKTVHYSLTEEGICLAKELLEDTKNRPTTNDIIFNDVFSSGSSLGTVSIDSHKCGIPDSDKDVVTAKPARTQSDLSQSLNLAAGSFDIILLIDKGETGGLSKKNDPTVAQFNKYPDLKHEYRSLKVGDFTWIARERNNMEHELVLPHIVERKRMDDLGRSIKDGRFHEQKFRLRKCGIKNVLYLVENYGSNLNVGLPFQSLMQALANTRVQDGFKVHITDSLTDSARFLAMMTKRLTIEYKDKSLQGCSKDPQEEMLMTFSYFNKSSIKSKPLTVTETFIKLLLQIKGVSVEKALAITDAYPTPKSLIKEYENCNSEKAGELLLKYANLSRNIGPAVSKSIYHVFK